MMELDRFVRRTRLRVWRTVAETLAFGILAFGPWLMPVARGFLGAMAMVSLFFLPLFVRSHREARGLQARYRVMEREQQEHFTYSPGPTEDL